MKELKTILSKMKLIVPLTENPLVRAKGYQSLEKVSKPHFKKINLLQKSNFLTCKLTHQSHPPNTYPKPPLSAPLILGVIDPNCL